MTDILLRREGKVGRVTFNRPKALNALTYDMCLKLDAALRAWATDDDVAMILIEGTGPRAFCAGGDIAEMYETGIKGDFGYGRRFWRDEYRMNARLFSFPKPVITFLHGYTMGGGVGVGCHGSHRIVGESSQVALPEVGIGLVPDVGGSLILSQAPGRLGEYLGTTATRMGPGDAILAGFADYFISESQWDSLKSQLVCTGRWDAVDAAATSPPSSRLAAHRAAIDRSFGGETLGDILRALRAERSEFATHALDTMQRNSPLAMACAVEIIHRLRGMTEGRAAIERALGLEYRFTYRAMEHADFLEGIRAAIIDKDRSPAWRHALDGVDRAEVSRMLLPLGRDSIIFQEDNG